MIVDVRTILNNVAEVWVIVDTRGTVLFFNGQTQKFQHIINPPLSEGVSIFNSIPESWRDLSGIVLTSLLTSNESPSLEASFKDDTGKEKFLEIKCYGIKDNAGKVAQIAIEAIDVTPQKIFENKITLIAREYQSLIENANAVIIGTDSRGYITEWNDMGTAVTGYSRNESLFQQLSGLLYCADCNADFTQTMDIVLSGNVITNYEMNILAKDSRKLNLLTNAAPKKSASGEVIGMLLISQDITELSAYRQLLEQKVTDRTKALKLALENEKELVQVKNRFVSMVSHEFKSPISFIQRNVEALKTHIDKLSAEEIHLKLDKIQSQSEHLSMLLEDVLTIGKSGTTKVKANMKEVDLRDFFHKIIDEVQTNTRHTHQILLAFPEPGLTIQSDENLLRNIFVNLLTNAIKFSPGQSAVFLTVSTNDHSVDCTIKDKGIGIEEKDILKIFEPFHRGENVQKIKGTGLGLPIVKKAVETLGGEISVQSNAGQGTIFTIQLNTIGDL